MKSFSHWILHVISRQSAGLFCALLMMVLYHKWSPCFVSALPFVYGVACWLPSFVRIKSSHLWPTLLCRPNITSQSLALWLFCTIEPSSHSVNVTSFSKNNVTPVFTLSAIGKVWRSYWNVELCLEEPQKKNLCTYETSVQVTPVVTLCATLANGVTSCCQAKLVIMLMQTNVFFASNFCWLFLSWKQCLATSQDLKINDEQPSL